MALSRPGVLPRGTIVFAHDVHLRQRDVGVGERLVEPNRFEQQRQRFVRSPVDAIELRQVVVRPRVGRLARDPGALLFDVLARFVVERGLDDLLAPEAHRFAPTSTIRTSITLVLVGPVINRSPSGSKYEYESLRSRAWRAPGLRLMVPPSAIAPAASVGPSVPSVPPLSTTVAGSPAISMAAASTNSWLRPPRPLP